MPKGSYSGKQRKFFKSSLFGKAKSHITHKRYDSESYQYTIEIIVGLGIQKPPYIKADSQKSC